MLPNKIHAIAGLTLLLFPFAILAEDAYVHGNNHCYYFNAPNGWILDNEAGRNQGVPMVLYPQGSSWESATTVIYTRSADFAPNAQTPQEKIKGQVDRVIEDFQTSGAGPAYQALLIDSVKSRSGTKGEIWKFVGDKWGNAELVAYFVGHDTINFFVMNSRNPKDLETSTPALLELASSYRDADDCIPCEQKSAGAGCKGRTKAPALDFSFSGRKPDTTNRPLKVTDGVLPGIPVLFDTTSPEQLVLRPAGEHETSNDTQPIYRFEWQEDKSARFYELVNPSMLEKLSRQNAQDTSTAEGKAYELKAIETFIDGAKVLQQCLPPNSSFNGLIVVYIVIGKDGKPEQTIVLPEGSTAECIAQAASNRAYASPPSRFTAKAEIRITN